MKLSFKLPQFGPELDLEAKLSLSIIVSFASAILTYLAIIGRAGSFGAIVGALIVNLLGRGSIVLPFSLFWLGIILFRLQKNTELARDFNSRLIWGLVFMLAALTGFLNIIFQVTDPSNMQLGGGLFGYIFYPVLFGKFDVIGGSILLFGLGLFGFFLVSQMTFAEFVDTIQDSLRNPGKLWNLVPDLFEAWKIDGKSSNTEEEIKSLKPKKEKKVSISKIEIVKQTETEAGSETVKIQEEKLQVVSSGNSEVHWDLPPFSILKENFTSAEPGDVEGNKQIIKDTLASFNIEVDMGEVVTGPTVSQYTLKPASGVKLSTIDSLQRDLALALAASSMRLEAPIPGKSLVGVEIPNKIKSQIRLRDLLQTKKFANFEQDLPVAIGSDVAGKQIIYSIAKMPHLLVAGATGSGKSVWINSMLLSLIYRYSPVDLELILIDMKRVELKLYEGIPHLLSPVITDAEKAINALKWTVVEMDRRYKLLEQYGKRNIVDYNKFARIAEIEELSELPYLVVVIDELGDLMILAKNEVEPIIVRLTQMSRAVGIHLILGTQRPDTHVVTGLIKANIPSRIAFAVASQIDSRVILDQGGAEKLLGQGDGLFMSPSSIKPGRFQGCFVEEAEVRDCVNFWVEQVGKNGGNTNLNLEVTDLPKVKIVVPGMVSKDDETGSDDIFEKCKNFVINQQAASTSMLQTAFGIGYPKARKIIDQLEAEGIVGPANGSKPRDVYIQAE